METVGWALVKPAPQQAVFTHVVCLESSQCWEGSRNVCATAAGSAFNLLSALEGKVDADQQQAHRKPRGLALPAGNDSLHLAGKTKALAAPLQATSPFTRSASCASLRYHKSVLASGSSVHVRFAQCDDNQALCQQAV